MAANTPQDHQAKSEPSAKEKQIVYCVALAALTFQFEAFLVNISLPDMARELQVSSTAVSFVVITYLLAATLAFLPAGHLGDRYGLRRVFLLGSALACLGTFLCGLSDGLVLLWCSRFLQGLGAGAMVATGYAMIPTWIAQERAGWGFGMLSMGAGLGMVLGLPAGGLLSYCLTWRWIFLGTLPIFLFLLWFGARTLPLRRPPPLSLRIKTKFDWPGLLVFSLMMSLLVLAISLGGETGWTSLPILMLLLASLACASTLLWRARAGISLLSRSLLQSAGFLPALLTLFLFQLVNAGVRFLAPFYLELGYGLSVLLSSALLLAYPLAYAPTGVWAGRLADRLGSRPVLLVALGLSAALCFAYASLLDKRMLWIFIIFMLGFGFASAMFTPPNNRLIMSNITEHERGQASALLPVALNMGSMLGVSVFDSIFTLEFPDHLVIDLGHASTSVHTQQLLNQGFEHAFLVAGLILFATMIGTRFFSESRHG